MDGQECHLKFILMPVCKLIMCHLHVLFCVHLVCHPYNISSCLFYLHMHPCITMPWVQLAMSWVLIWIERVMRSCCCLVRVNSCSRYVWIELVSCQILADLRKVGQDTNPIFNGAVTTHNMLLGHSFIFFFS